MSGNARLDDLSEHLGFELEAEGIDTIGGLVFNRLGYLPPSGTQVEIPRLTITIRRAGRKRIEEMLLEKTSCLNRRLRGEPRSGGRAMILWFAILGAWAVSFLFAGIEAGLLSVDPVRLRYHVKRRTPGAARLNRLLKHPERLLVTVLLVTNLANILGLLLLTKLLVASLGYGGFFVAGAVGLPIYLFVLNVLPKSLFRRFPFRALAALGGVLEGTSIVSLAVFGNRPASWPPLPSASRRGPGPSLRGAGRIETDRRAKRTRRRSHVHRASDDP